MPVNGTTAAHTAVSDEGRISAAAGAAVVSRKSSPPTSELSTGKMNPQAPGWNKRLRIGVAAPIRTPCPSRVSAFKKAVRGVVESPTDNVITPALGTSFDLLCEAYDFYNLYSWEKEFGVRYGKNRLNVETTKCMQEIVYGYSGKAGIENTGLAIVNAQL